jgi:Glycosyl transferase family 2
MVSGSEKTDGMYGAVNRGFGLARVRVIAHPNCDDQYLPGTLATVIRYFDRHPDVDVLFGDVLTVRPDGSLIAYWKAIRPFRALLSLPPLYIREAGNDTATRCLIGTTCD